MKLLCDPVYIHKINIFSTKATLKPKIIYKKRLKLKDVVFFFFFRGFLVPNAPQNIAQTAECLGSIVHPVYTNLAHRAEQFLSFFSIAGKSGNRYSHHSRWGPNYYIYFS